MTDSGKVDSTSLTTNNNARSVYKIKVFYILNYYCVFVKIFMCMKVNQLEKLEAAKAA